MKIFNTTLSDRLYFSGTTSVNADVDAMKRNGVHVMFIGPDNTNKKACKSAADVVELLKVARLQNWMFVAVPLHSRLLDELVGKPVPPLQILDGGVTSSIDDVDKWRRIIKRSKRS